MNRNLHVASAGLGINTIAGLILATKKGIIFDAINFANPGKEHPDTYKYLYIINPWLLAHGQPAINVLHQNNNKGQFVGLYNDCINQQMLPSVAYGHKSCSQKFKRAPQDKWCNNWPIAKQCWKNGFKIVKYIFFDIDEGHRTEKDFSDAKYDYCYLLVQHELSRFDCIKIIIDEGLPLPPKSSCTFCPSMKPYEIIELYETQPKEFYDAIIMEINAEGNLLTIKGLGRDFSWWELILAYKYFKFVKRSNNAFIQIPFRIKKMVNKAYKSIRNSQKRPINIKKQLKTKQADTVVCNLFTNNIHQSCDCMT
jgi:hypothetical protein